METKVCTKCGIEKEKSEFRKRNPSRDGYDTQCKLCHKIRVNKWILENKERYKSLRKRRAQTERGRMAVCARARRYKEKNIEKIREWNRLGAIKLPDWYVAKRIRCNKLRGLKLEDIPKQLIDLKRNVLQIQREIKTEIQ